MNDHDSVGDDAFTAEEQAQFDAYASGSDNPAEPASAPADADVAAPAAVAAVEPAAAPGEAAVPGDVVDPEVEDGSAEENKGKFVRHGAFHQERERRKAVERELTEMREKFARGDERLRLLNEAMTRAPQAAAAEPAAAEPETPPDPNEDIFGYAKWLEKQVSDLRSGQQQMTETQKQAAESQRVAEEERAVVSTYQQDVARFAQAEPTFVEGYNFLIQGRVAELKHFGLSDADAIKGAQADEMALIRAALQSGKSPAEHVFAMAKLRGFAPKAADPAPAAPTETAAEKAARVAAGQAASKSLSAAGGGPAGEVTIEMLASMSEADFEKFAKANPRQLSALMGAN